MKKFQLGEFEEVVMLTVGILYKDAYGVSIKKEIETRLNRGVSVGALQTALNLRVPVTVATGALPRFEMKARRWVRE